MKGDRQKCLDAGASDYIAKPVDIDLLLALLRVWIGAVARAGGAEPTVAARSAPRNRVNGRASMSDRAGAASDGRAPAPPRGADRAARAGRRRRRAQSARASRRCSRTSPRSSSPPRARRRCASCSRASSRSSCSTSSCPGMDGYETAQIIRSARADQAHPDRLPLGGQQGDRASDARLCDGRGRLCVQAGRSGRAPLEGRGVRRPVRDDPARSQRKARAGAGAARRESARQCRAAARRAGAAPRRAAPGGDHRSRCRSSSISSRSTPTPRMPAVRQRQFRGGDRLRVRAGPRQPDLCGPSGSIRDDRERVVAALARAAASGRMAVEYRWRCADGELQAFPRPGGAAARRRRRSRSNMPAPCSTSPSASSSRASWSRPARWTRSAS